MTTKYFIDTRVKFYFTCVLKQNTLLAEQLLEN